MGKLLDLSSITTPKLQEIRRILSTGVVAVAEDKTESSVDETAQANSEELMEKEIKDLQEEIGVLKSERDALAEKSQGLETSKVELASQIDSLTTELTDLRTEVEGLRQFKAGIEEAEAKAQKLSAIKEKVKEAGVETDVDTEAEYWLSMSDELIDKTLKMIASVQTKKAEASVTPFKVPPVSSEANQSDCISTARKYLSEKKGGKNFSEVN